MSEDVQMMLVSYVVCLTWTDRDSLSASRSYGYWNQSSTSKPISFALKENSHKTFPFASERKEYNLGSYHLITSYQTYPCPEHICLQYCRQDQHELDYVSPPFLGAEMVILYVIPILCSNRSLIMNFCREIVLPGHSWSLLINSQIKIDQSVTNYIPLLVNWPYKSTCNTSSGIQCGVKILLHLITTFLSHALTVHINRQIVKRISHFPREILWSKH